MALIGKEISDFKVNAFVDGEFKEVSKEDLLGRWSVFVFYPADFTFVCPTELSDLADHHDEFTKIGADIYSVSTDSHFVHKAWHEASELLRKLQAAQFVAEHGDQVCPAKWRPGEETLTPGIDLVGKL